MVGAAVGGVTASYGAGLATYYPADYSMSTLEDKGIFKEGGNIQYATMQFGGAAAVRGRWHLWYHTMPANHSE